MQLNSEKCLFPSELVPNAKFNISSRCWKWIHQWNKGIFWFCCNNLLPYLGSWGGGGGGGWGGLGQKDPLTVFPL